MRVGPASLRPVEAALGGGDLVSLGILALLAAAAFAAAIWGFRAMDLGPIQ